MFLSGLAFVCSPAPARAARVLVNPGDSLQAAVDGAAPGDTILVMPGDYTTTNPGPAALVITKPLRLIGKSTPLAKVRLLPSAGQNHGILVQPANVGDPDIDGLRIQGFTVEGFSNMGIWLRHVQHFRIERNESIDNLENGIWPTLSANGLVRKNVSYGSQDAALWVEASEDVRVIANDLHDSPTGLEVTVSNNIKIMRNEVHNNTVGMGLYHPATAGLPPLQPVSRNGYSHVINNYIHDNNAVNTGDPNSETAALPLGIGILVLGADHNDIQKNRVENNDFIGIAMIDYCIATSGGPFDCTINPPEVTDTAPDFNQFIGNKLSNNHTNPPPGPFQPFAADIVAIGGANNCYTGNMFAQPAVTIPSPLSPGC